MIQRNTIPGSLSWSHINSQEYQLHGEGRVLATLKIDDDLDSSMTGECGTCKWTFKRSDRNIERLVNMMEVDLQVREGSCHGVQLGV